MRVAGLGLLVLSVLIAAVIGAPALRHLATHRWATLSCRVESVAVVDTGFAAPTSKRPTRPRVARLDVTYRYEFAGRAFQSNRLDLDYARALGEHAELTRQAAAFRPGQSIPCFVNPRDPDEAILVRGLPPGLAGTTALAMVAAVVPAVLGLSFLRGWWAARRRKAAP